MNSHFSLVLVTCRSSENIPSLRPSPYFPLSWKHSDVSKLQVSAPSQESFGEPSSNLVSPQKNFSPCGGLPARTLAQVSTHLIPPLIGLGTIKHEIPVLLTEEASVA